MKKFLFCLFIFLSNYSFATHIVGGELNYRALGSDNYEITLIVYRDCFNGKAPFDDPAYFFIFDSLNNYVGGIEMPLRKVDPIPKLDCDTKANICYEKGSYIDTINLPPIAGGYTLVYQRCCRNQQIINIQDPASTGVTFFAKISNSFTGNSNPVFKNILPSYICVNTEFSFDNSAAGIDKDSLVYELYTPLSGADTVDPYEDPSKPPLFEPIVFGPGYSKENFFGGIPLMIDSKTGRLTAKPSHIGTFAFGVIVKKYRNSIYLNSTIRDFQINVVDCETCTGITSREEEMIIKTYPNPTNEILNVSISLKSLNDVGLCLSDLYGNTVYSGTIVQSEGKHQSIIDLKNYSKGIYLLRVITDHEIFNKKIIIE